MGELFNGIAPDEKDTAKWRNLQKGFAAGLDGKWEGSVIYFYCHTG